MSESPRPTTLGELRASGWVSTSVKDEIRRNAITRIAAGQPLVEGVLGYEETVLPQLENALLAGQDIIFLGERGQAKSRIIRSLVELLEEEVPTLAPVVLDEGGTHHYAQPEFLEDPFDPISAIGRKIIHELGDNAPITWAGRDQRYGEKLATPDITIADLI